jgi:WS/DGAT/MGAT family acyltransferase
MHIAATAIFEPGFAIAASGGGVRIDQIRRYIASRLHLVPRYRQRLAYLPVTMGPIWVDDERFDLAYHVRHVSLPRPGSDAQLRALCARVLERQLDRRRPLWEVWFVEGLEGGAFAMITKVHHCMVDGIAGVDLLAALFTVEPQSEIENDKPWQPLPAPSGAVLLRDESIRRARTAMGTLAKLGRGRRPVLSSLRRTTSGIWSLARSGLQRTGPMPFNGAIGPHRRVEWFEVDLDSIKHVRKTLGGTLNDVVLATVAGAMHRFLPSLGVRVQDNALRTAVPVSVRTADQHGTAGNRVSAWLADLPIGERDPWKRLTSVRQVTDSLRESHQAAGTQILTEIAEWTGANLLGIALRVLNRTKPYHLIVTNVPGPPISLYLLDARMRSIYPHLPLFENQGLGVALLSYAGKLAWGLTSDWDLLPGLDELRESMARSSAELERLSRIVAATERLGAQSDRGGARLVRGSAANAAGGGKLKARSSAP